MDAYHNRSRFLSNSYLPSVSALGQCDPFFETSYSRAHASDPRHPDTYDGNDHDPMAGIDFDQFRFVKKNDTHTHIDMLSGVF